MENLLASTPTTLRGLAALLSLGTALGAQAADRSYPGAAPCDTTLQACIDGADSGDRILLQTNDYIAEDVVIHKSLTLAAELTVQPSVRTVIARASTASVEATVLGLTSLGGPSRVSGLLEPGGGNLLLTVHDSTLVGTGWNSALEIVTSSQEGNYGFAQAQFRGNAITQSGMGDLCAPGIGVIGFGPLVGASILRNEVTANELGQCAAITLYDAGMTLDAQVGASLAAHAEVRHNIVRGSGADAGILVRNSLEGGQMRASVVGNLVTGNGFDAGLKAVADNAEALVDVRLVHNTVVGARRGVFATADTGRDANVIGVVANNLFARHAGGGLDLQHVPGLADHHNLIFASPTPPGARPYGPATRHGNPSFVNEASRDYRLRANSDAIDQGDNDDAGAIYVPDGLDLDGQPRRVRVVDMGAYEFQGAAEPPIEGPPGPATPVPATGPWAMGAGATLLALLTGTRLRRKRR